MTQAKPHTRLYVAEPLLIGALVVLDDARSHYLLNVMRKREGDQLAVFNADSGEWLAEIESASKRGARLLVREKIADAREATDVWLAFAMIKNKSELVVEKATELGVSVILPVVTQHSVVKHANLEKLEGYAIEAAEQCERHDVPRIIPQKNLASLLGDWPKDRILLYGDETGGGEPLSVILSEAKDLKDPSHVFGMTKLGVLIGPEGGFSADEIRMLRLAPFAKAFGMGPRILRADTAAVAALACIQSVRGDWQQRPHFKGTEL